MLRNWFSPRETRYCAFCRKPKKVYSARNIGIIHILCSIFIGLLLTWLIWEGPEAKGLLLILILVMGSELFVHFRWRLGIICQNCGFDPLTYRKRPEEACSQVQKYIERRRLDPRFLLVSPLNLPKLSVLQKNLPRVKLLGPLTESKVGANAGQKSKNLIVKVKQSQVESTAT